MRKYILVTLMACFSSFAPNAQAACHACNDHKILVIPMAAVGASSLGLFITEVVQSARLSQEPRTGLTQEDQNALNFAGGFQMGSALAQAMPLVFAAMTMVCAMDIKRHDRISSGLLAGAGVLSVMPDAFNGLTASTLSSFNGTNEDQRERIKAMQTTAYAETVFSVINTVVFFTAAGLIWLKVVKPANDGAVTII